MTKAQRLVRRALEDYPITRGSDRHLIVAVWHLQGIVWHDSKQFILNDAIMPETITRIRRKLQENGLYLPNGEVTEKRYARFVAVRGGDLDSL